MFGPSRAIDDARPEPVEDLLRHEAPSVRRIARDEDRPAGSEEVRRDDDVRAVRVRHARIAVSREDDRPGLLAGERKVPVEAGEAAPDALRLGGILREPEEPVGHPRFGDVEAPGLARVETLFDRGDVEVRLAHDGKQIEQDLGSRHLPVEDRAGEGLSRDEDETSAPLPHQVLEQVGKARGPGRRIRVVEDDRVVEVHLLFGLGKAREVLVALLRVLGLGMLEEARRVDPLVADQGVREELELREGMARDEQAP